jgi:chorismate-pyruvate lyase
LKSEHSLNSPGLKSADLPALTSEFYVQLKTLGEFWERGPQQVPEPYRRLLDHHSHMTVALEQFHGCPVLLRVREVHDTPTSYSRKLVLERQCDGRVVLFGLMRLRPESLPAEVMSEIRAQIEPLGHVLIKHNVSREVQRLHLWQVTPGRELREAFSLGVGEPVYGRTALIHCNGQPAIELLEIIRADAA